MFGVLIWKSFKTMNMDVGYEKEMRGMKCSIIISHKEVRK